MEQKFSLGLRKKVHLSVEMKNVQHQAVEVPYPSPAGSAEAVGVQPPDRAVLPMGLSSHAQVTLCSKAQWNIFSHCLVSAPFRAEAQDGGDPQM